MSTQKIRMGVSSDSGFYRGAVRKNMIVDNPITRKEIADMELTADVEKIDGLSVRLTNQCNLKCIMCSYGTPSPQKIVRRQVLSDLVDKLLPYGLNYVALAGGEPTMHPDILGIVDDLYERNIDITLVSNGTYLGKLSDAFWDKIFRLVISIDAIDASSYLSIRGANAFPHIIETVTKIKAYRPTLHVTFAVVVQKNNFRQIPGFIDLALHLGVDRISFLSLDFPSMINPKGVCSGAFGHTAPYDTEKLDNIRLNAEDIRELREKIIPSLHEKLDANPQYWNKSTDMLLDLANYYEAHLLGKPRGEYRRCGLPFNEVAIDEDENLRFCFFTPERWKFEPNMDPVNHTRAVETRKDYLSSDKKCQNYCAECLQTVRLPITVAPAARPPDGGPAFRTDIPDRIMVINRHSQP